MMLKEKLHILEKKIHSQLWLEGLFGIEKENVRVNYNGGLALTAHPEMFGDKLEHPYVTTDFSESQVEMVTPPLPSIKETLGFLETLHDVVALELKDELLWPQSAPPILPKEEDIPIARYSQKGRPHEEYREMLAVKYGKKIQMISGIHLNFSFSESLLLQLNKLMRPDLSFDDFVEYAYLKTAKNILQYRWLPILLFGATPVAHETFETTCKGDLNESDRASIIFPNTVSYRNTRCGYRNKEEFHLDYSSFESYCKTLSDLVESKKLYHAKELYSSVRLKFDPKSNGFSHLEMRFLDLNPKYKVGLDEDEVRFVHALAIYALVADDINFHQSMQDLACHNHEMVARKGLDLNLRLIKPDLSEVSANEWALEVLHNMKKTFLDLGIDDEAYVQSFEKIESLIKYPELRAAAEVLNNIKKKGYVQYHLDLAKYFLEQSRHHNYAFKGFEDLELSTQLLMRASLRRGVFFEILDRKENFLRLSRGHNSQMVCQATKTSLDNYVSILMMENKVITKKILDEHGVRVPSGSDYFDADTAKNDFYRFKSQAVVIKPKSTNFGLGISILKVNEDQKVFNRAIELAFEQDDSILIEEFISGKEYRIFVMDDEVVGILHRVPANVIGDGQRNIRQLVEIKNQDPLRGVGYRTPLEKIKLNEPELIFLKEQGFDFDTVPEKGQQIFLRENSNISTGGDSIDFTDEVHASYKEIAVKAMKSMNVRITGLDMMIDDISKQATSKNYAIIELNFNPAIHIHCHPYIGENRQLNEKLLDMLGF